MRKYVGLCSILLDKRLKFEGDRTATKEKRRKNNLEHDLFRTSIFYFKQLKFAMSLRLSFFSCFLT